MLDAVLEEFDISSDITDHQVNDEGGAPAREVGFFADLDVRKVVRIAVDSMIRVRAETFC